MGPLVTAALTALHGFRDEVASWTNSGLLKTLDDHIAQIETAAREDVRAGETAVKAVFTELYGSLHGAAPTPDADAPVEVEPTPAPLATGGPVAGPTTQVGEDAPGLIAPPAAPAEPQPVDATGSLIPAPDASASPALADPATAPAAADPTPAPSTTAEDSSALSSTPSTSTEVPAVDTAAGV